jgi:hypothetical protein
MTTKLHGTEIEKTRMAIERLLRRNSTWISDMPKDVTLRKHTETWQGGSTYIQLYIGEECVYSSLEMDNFDTFTPIEKVIKEITYVGMQYKRFLGSITSKAISRQRL